MSDSACWWGICSHVNKSQLIYRGVSDSGLVGLQKKHTLFSHYQSPCFFDIVKTHHVWRVHNQPTFCFPSGPVLPSLGRAAPRPRLTQCLKDADHVVRRSAAVSLGRIGLLGARSLGAEKSSARRRHRCPFFGWFA